MDANWIALIVLTTLKAYARTRGELCFKLCLEKIDFSLNDRRRSYSILPFKLKRNEIMSNLAEVPANTLVRIEVKVKFTRNEAILDT